MTATLGRYHVLSWPIWLKLLIGLVTAALVPIAFIALAMQSALQDLGNQSLRSYVSENGQRQLQGISDAFEQARGDLNVFARQDVHVRRLTNLLLADTPLIRASDIRVSPEDIERLFATELLDAPTSMFDSVRLLDRHGQLIAASAQDTARAEVVRRDQSRETAYRAAVSETIRAEGASQVMSVSILNDTPVIEITNIIRWRDGKALGFLIAELDIPQTVYPFLASDEARYSVHSFLISGRRVVITREETRELAAASADAPGANQGLAGETGIETYLTSESSIEVLGFFAPIANSPLALVLEAPVAAAALQTQSYFDSRMIPVSLAGLLLAVLIALGLWRILAPPLHRLRLAAEHLTAEGSVPPLRDARRGDEIGALARALNEAHERLAQMIAGLHANITTRTRDIRATQDISRYAVSERDLPRLLDRVVNLIVRRFPDIYHAQIFLLDSDGRDAVLRSSTGDAGRALLERGHRLAADSTSVIGRVVDKGQVVLVDDTENSSVHAPNKLLSETRAELGIPLRIGEDVIGALDVQSRSPHVFNDDLVSILQTMADQIAIAIQNARLYEESMRRLKEIERNNQRAARDAWHEYMRGGRTRDLLSESGIVTGAASGLRGEALRTGELVVGKPTERQTVPLAVPIRLRGHVLGVVEWEVREQDLDGSRLQLAQDLADRLAVSLDSARLFEESQRATERERIVNMISAQLTAQSRVDDILRTAVREVGQALHAPEVVIQLQAGPEDQSQDAEPRYGNGSHR